MLKQRVTIIVALVFALLSSCAYTIKVSSQPNPPVLHEDTVQCSTVGCKVCFDPQVCLLCDSSLFYEELPVEDKCVCQEGRWAKSGSCKTCSNIIDLCESCSLEDGNVVCDKCGISSYRAGPNICSLCNDHIPHCLSCSSSTVCTKCLDSYFLNKSSCAACGSGCKTCTSNTSCSECLEMYHLNGTTCKLCVANCLHCNDATNCVQCAQGFYIRNQSLQPKNCVKCINNCLTCSAADTCDSCPANNYFDLINKECKECFNLPFCKTCSFDGQCSQCLSNEYWVNAGKC